MKILFLDDSSQRHSIFKQNAIGCSVDHVYTAKEAIEKLNNPDIHYDTIFLDHDLNEEKENQLNDNEEDGRMVAKFLSEIDRYSNSLIIIHSLNSPASLIMSSILQNKGFNSVYCVPFAWKKWKRDGSNNWVILED